MKTRILLLLALLPALVAGQGVNFRDIPLDSALLAAAREGKHLFIDGYTAWCGPCKLMDNEIFPLQVLGDYFNPRFVSVKYDMERHPDGVALAARFGVKAYPTFIILDSTNQLLHLFAGGVLGPEFIDKVNDAFDDDKAFGTLSRRLASNPDDAALRVRHLQALQATYTRDVSGLADTLWASLSPDERLHPACLFLLDDLAPDGSPRARYLFQHLEEYRSSSTPAAVDAILKKKYIERYTRVLRGQRPLAPDWLDLTRRQIDSLHLTGAAILRLYDQALRLRLASSPTPPSTSLVITPASLVDSIFSAAPALLPLDLDLYLYLLLSTSATELGADRARALLPLVSTDRSRDYIAKSAKL